VIARLRGAWWALRAVWRVRRDLRRSSIDVVRVARPSGLPRTAGRGVHAVIRRLEPSCLERALVLQAWLDAGGDARDVIIGVTPRAPGFQAHAWLDGESARGFAELRRVKP
jgi:hypothetical protein